MRKKEEILSILSKQMPYLKERFSVNYIGLFGSYSRGEQKESSDIDILVEFNKSTFDNYMELIFYLEELFGETIELVTKKSLNPEIAEYVLEDVIWCEA